MYLFLYLCQPSEATHWYCAIPGSIISLALFPSILYGTYILFVPWVHAYPALFPVGFNFSLVFDSYISELDFFILSLASPEGFRYFFV
jgi:hypothetical protein